MYVPGTDILKPKCRLVGEDGNAFSIMGRVSAALRNAHVPKEIITEYKTKSMSGDYNNLLRTAVEYIDCDEEAEED